MATTEIDEQIERLRKGDTLAENEVKALCEKVRFLLVLFWFFCLEKKRTIIGGWKVAEKGIRQLHHKDLSSFIFLGDTMHRANARVHTTRQE